MTLEGAGVKCPKATAPPCCQFKEARRRGGGVSCPPQQHLKRTHNDWWGVLSSVAEESAAGVFPGAPREADGERGCPSPSIRHQQRENGRLTSSAAGVGM